MPDRTILHCDLNSFYASVELLSLPELRDKPVAVTHDPSGHRSVILAKNDHAKKFGVATAETVYRAKQKCPELVLITPHHERYHEYSRKINELYQRYTDLVEPFGIDESWLDITGSMHLFGGTGLAVAERIKKEVFESFGLTLSIGVSFNKIFAKLGSDYKKPDAITVIDRNNFQRLLYPLPASALLYVGKVAARELNSIGIRTIGDLANAGREVLERAFGKSGAGFYYYAAGLDTSPVCGGREAENKSMGHGSTFSYDLTSTDEIHAAILLFSDSIASQMRRSGQKCSSVQLTLRDVNFKTITRQKRLERPSHLTREIADCAYALLRDNWPAGKPLRMLTVTGQQLVSAAEEYEQLSLIEPEKPIARERLEKLESAVDTIRGRYGHAAIMPGALLERRGDEGT